MNKRYTLLFGLVLLGVCGLLSLKGGLVEEAAAFEGVTIHADMQVSYASQLKTRFNKKISKREWSKLYPFPDSGYAPGSTPADAANRFINIGPLGVRALGHDRERINKYAVCRANAPSSLMDKRGELFRNCLEVQTVAPGSPADGKLKKGDLILSINGASIKKVLQKLGKIFRLVAIDH